MDKNNFSVPLQRVDNRKLLIDNLEAARKEKADNKLRETNSIKIQCLARSYIAISRLKNTLCSRMIKRLSDLVIVEKSMKNPEFCLPLATMNDFLRDFNYLCFKFIPNNTYCDRKNKKFNDYQLILEKMSYWLNKSLKTQKENNNILKSFLVSEIHSAHTRRPFNDPIVKNKLLQFNNQPQITTISNRAFINICSYLRNVLKNFSFLQNYTWKENLISSLSSILSIDRLSSDDQKSYSQLSANFFVNLFDAEKLYSHLNFQVSQMIHRNTPKNKIEQVIEIGFFQIQFYSILSATEKGSLKEKYFNSFVASQEQFILKIMSIPKVDEFAISSQTRISTLFPHLNWKNLFSSFIFQNVSDPLSLAGEREFIKKFSQNNQTQFIHIFGNSVRILQELIHLKVEQNNNYQQIHLHDSYFFLKFMSYCLNFLTPTWFSKILVNFSIDDKEVIALGEKINLLFDKNFAMNLFSIAFKQDFITNNSSTFTKKQIEQFNPEIANIICEIYSKILAIASQSEASHRLTIQIISSFAQCDSLNFRLFSHICTAFHSIDCLTEGNLSQEEQTSATFVFSLLIVSYYNYLTILDHVDFFSDKNKSIPLSKLPLLIQSLIKFIHQALSQSNLSSPQQFLAFQSSKLLRLLYEFDRRKPIMKANFWLLQPNQIAGITAQIDKFQFNCTSIVRAMPFAIPFETRIRYLKQYILSQKQKNDVAFKIVIRRNNLFEDGFQAFRQISQVDLQAKLRVVYEDEFGNEERGIDAGGIFKEFLNDLSKIVFDPNYGMFKLAEGNQKLYPNENSGEILGSDHLEIYYFLGSVVGRAIFDEIIISPIFSIFFLRRMIGKLNNLIELEHFDKELYKNLKFLKQEFQGDAKDLSLTFSVVGSNQKEISLIPNGKNIPVDNNNLLKYIYKMADYKMNQCIESQTRAFMSGLTRVIPKQWLQIFDESEIQMLISGQEKGIDIEDLKKNTNYEGGYSSWDFYIKDFWKIIMKFSDEDKILLIKFVTSCERAPLLGFKNLFPNFTIAKVSSDGDEKLPQSSTCFNKLNLPKYSSTSKLQDKLLLAIRSGQGFYLS